MTISVKLLVGYAHGGSIFKEQWLELMCKKIDNEIDRQKLVDTTMAEDNYTLKVKEPKALAFDIFATFDLTNFLHDSSLLSPKVFPLETSPG